MLLASFAVVLAALAVGRRTEPAAAAGGPRSRAPLRPSPLPSGAEPEAIALPDDEAEIGCNFEDRGFGAYGGWRPLPLGKALVSPSSVASDGEYDLLVHFHGAEPVRRELAPLDLGLVIAAIDAGTRSSHYNRALRDRSWYDVLASIDRVVMEATGVAGARARRVVVSSWSAGSGAVARIVERPSPRLDALILLDSLYAGYASGRPALIPGQLAPFVAMADAAARGGPLFYLTHTAIPTTGYASTGEVATFLLDQIGARAIDVTPNEGDPMPLTRMYDGGNLYVRGHAGTTREAHCAELRLLPSILVEHVLQ